MDEATDAFGRMLIDHLEGRPASGVLERDDGWTQPALDPSIFFSEYDAWPPYERRAIDLVRGRVLDVGCGAGRHALELQRRGHDVVAIDASPGAVAVARRRGVRDVRLVSLASVTHRLGTFESVLMMCGNFGLFGTATGAEHGLRRLHSVTSGQARVFADSVDPHAATDPAHVAYRRANVGRGALPGHVRIRIRYGDVATPWFDLLNVAPTELAELVASTGWLLAETLPSGGPSYVGILAKDLPAAQA